MTGTTVHEKSTTQRPTPPLLSVATRTASRHAANPRPPETRPRFISQQINFTVGRNRQSNNPCRGVHERTHRYKNASSPTPIAAVRRKQLPEPPEAAHQMDGRRKKWGPKTAGKTNPASYTLPTKVHPPLRGGGGNAWGQTETPGTSTRHTFFQPQN